MKKFWIIYIVVMIIIGVAGKVRGDEILNIHTLEIYMDGFSHHDYHCKPNCMNQAQETRGWQLGYFGHMDFINSFGNPGYIDYMELALWKRSNEFVRAEAGLIAGIVGGYTKTPLVAFWWYSEIGINIFELFSAGKLDMQGAGFLNFHFTGVPQVAVCWIGFSVINKDF